MDNIEELKKYKELLDSGVITEEEFNQKKKELLALDTAPISKGKTKKEKKPVSPKKKKAILAAAAAVVVVIAAVFGIKTAVNASQTAKRNAAVIEHIEPIMTEYGITDYTVGDIDDGFNISFDVYAEGFEDLTNGEAMELLKALGSVDDLDDPCGGERISLPSVDIYPGKDAGYYYYRVSTAQLLVSNYKKAGIYSSYGPQCVYECDN